MRAYAYDKISEQLAALTSNNKKVVQHIDLWNEQVQYMAAEKPMRMPAVFLEFNPVAWKQHPDGLQRGTMEVRVHIVVGTLARSYDGSHNKAEAMQALGVADTIHNAMHKLEADFMSRPVRVSSLTDHNHAQVQHFIEVYQMNVVDVSGMKMYGEATVEVLKVNGDL